MSADCGLFDWAKAVERDQRLSQAALGTLLMLGLRATIRTGRDVFPSLSNLAGIRGMSRSAISRHVRQGVALGWLQLVEDRSRWHKPNIYALSIPTDAPWANVVEPDMPTVELPPKFEPISSVAPFEVVQIPQRRFPRRQEGNGKGQYSPENIALMVAKREAEEEITRAEVALSWPNALPASTPDSPEAVAWKAKCEADRKAEQRYRQREEE